MIKSENIIDILQLMSILVYIDSFQLRYFLVISEVNSTMSQWTAVNIPVPFPFPFPFLSLSAPQR